MASVRSGRSRASSSEVSRPPTSESEGTFDEEQDSDEEADHDEVEAAPARRQKLSTSTKVCR